MPSCVTCRCSPSPRSPWRRQAVAQERPGAARPKPPQTKAWVKLCETPTSTDQDLFGKPGEVGVKTCLIHHERLDSTSGDLQVAAGVRQAGDRLTFTVMVPSDVHRPAGTRVDILPLDLWQKVLRREQIKWIELPRVKTLKLKFAFCRAEGCTAETEATPSSWRTSDRVPASWSMPSGMDSAPRASRRPLFAAAYDGPATDRARFYAARAELLRRLRERRGPRLPPQRPRPQDI